MAVFFSTVWMKSLTMFSGALHLPHNYKSNFAHLLAFKDLVIEFLNAKRWAQKMTRCEARKFAHCWYSTNNESSLLLVQKYYLLDHFFNVQIKFSNLLGNLVRFCSDYLVENNTKLYLTITPFHHPPFHHCPKMNL